MYHITTEQIETFLTLAQNHSFRETSELLFITQPTVTKLIQRLERELGVSLFLRSTHSVTLTEAGSRLAEIWSPLYMRFTESIDEAQFLAGKKKDELIVSILPDYRTPATAENVMDLFHAYLERHGIPPITLRCRFLSMHEQRDALRRHLVDFSFSLGFDYDNLRHIETLTLSRKRIFALLPSDHPLAERDEISIQELSDETILVLSAVESFGVNKVTVAMLQKFLPKARIEVVPNFQSMSFAIRHHKGVTLGNRYFAPHEDFAEVPVTELQNAGYEETLVWHTDDMSLNKMIFLNFIKESAGKLV